MNLHRLAALLLTSTVLLAGGVACAAEAEDTAAPGNPIHPSERTGWTIGLMGGMADLHVYPKGQSEQVLSGNGIGLEIGRAFAQNLLLSARAEVVDPDSNTSNSAYSASASYFANQWVYLRGGVGIANFHTTGNGGGTAPGNNEDRWAPAGTVGLGVEAIQFRKVAFDAQLDWMGSIYSKKDPIGNDITIKALNVSLMLGVRWYGI